MMPKCKNVFASHGSACKTKSKSEFRAKYIVDVAMWYELNWTMNLTWSQQWHFNTISNQSQVGSIVSPFLHATDHRLRLYFIALLKYLF